MAINYIHKVCWFVGLVLLQVLILNHVHLGGYATPFLYVYLLLTFESTVSRNEAMLWGLFLGLSVDVFSNTPGMHASATVLLAFVRPFCLGLFAPRDIQEIKPSCKSLGVASFLKYVFLAVLIHHTFLFAVSFFSFTDIKTLLLQSISSTLLTVLCILAIDASRS